MENKFENYHYDISKKIQIIFSISKIIIGLSILLIFLSYPLINNISLIFSLKNIF